MILQSFLMRSSGSFARREGLLLEKGEEKKLEKEEELFFSAEASLKTGESVMLTGKDGEGCFFLFWDSNGDTKILFLRGVLRFFGEKKVSFSSMNCRWRAISGR